MNIIRVIAYFVMAMLTLSNCSVTQQQVPADGTWQAVTTNDGSLPVARHEAAFINLRDKFLLLGGRRVNPTSIYYAKRGIWKDASKPPLEIHHFQPVVYQEKIYIMGAFTGGYPGETPIPNIYIYDPKTDQWEKGPLIPEDRRRGAAGVAVFEDKIYMACGIKDGHRGDHKQWLDVFDPQTETWSTLPDAPRPRDHFQATVADGQLFLLGGRTTIAADNPFRHTITEVDVFDFKKQAWRTLKAGLPTPRAGSFNLLWKDEILVIGGESFTQEPAHAEVEALHIPTEQWKVLPPLIQGRHGTGIIHYKDKFYIASGSGNRGGGPELQTMECRSSVQR